MHEFATDVTTIYMGFGLSGGNRAFNYSQHQDFLSQSWQWSRQGYLRERDWAFGLATFFHLPGQSGEAARLYLKPYLYNDLAKAERYLRRLKPAIDT